MDSAQILRQARSRARLSVRALADAAGVAASTIHRIEQGDVKPSLEMLTKIVESAGSRLNVDAVPDYAVSISGLALAVRAALANEDTSQLVGLAAELVHRFRSLETASQRRMLAAEPQPTGEQRWDAFVAGLAEWLAVRAGLPAPDWTHKESRYLPYGWWVVPSRSMQAWEYAGTPVSLQARGVFIHRDSLTNV